MPKGAGKATHIVEWTTTARDDLDDIIGYILARDPLNALAILDKLEAKAATLNLSPQRGRIIPELKFHGVTTYRELIIKPWRLMYRIDEQRVWVVSLLDSRRQLDSLLLERFLRN